MNIVSNAANNDPERKRRMNGIFNFSLNKYDVFIFLSGVSSNFLNNVSNIYVVICKHC